MKTFGDKTEDFKQIYLMPYMHCDFSWTNSRKWHIWRYITGYKKVLEIMREDPDYTYIIDNVQHSWLPFKKYFPELVEEFRLRVKEGRIVIANGGYALDRPDYNGYEGFVRNVIAGKEYFNREFEIPENESGFYFNADTGIGNSQLPQILKKSGYKYYRSNRPALTMNNKGIPRQFRWKGMDGTEIIVARGDYGGLFVTDYFEKYPDMEKDWDNIKDEFWKTEKAQATNSVTDKLMLFFGCDDVIPGCNLIDKPVPYKEFLEQWNKREPSEFRISTPGKYFSEIEKEDLPTVEGILDNCELSFVSVQKGEQALHRKHRILERSILKLEYLYSILKSFGYEYNEKEVDELWMHLFNFSGHAIEYALKEDIEILENEAIEAIIHSAHLINEAEEQIALAVNIDSKPDEGVTRYVVINPYPEERTEYVKIHVTTPHGMNGLKLTDTKGNVLPYQATEVFTADKAYQCRCNSANVIVPITVPACGWETVTAETSEGKVEYVREQLDDFSFILGQDSEPVTVDNGVIKATFINGKLTEVTDGKNTVKGNIGQINFTESNPKSWCWLPFWNGEEYSLEPEAWALIKNGPLCWQYRIKGTLRTAKVIVDVTIKKNSPRIDYNVTLDCERNEGFFTAAFPCDSDSELYASVPYGVEKRTMKDEPSFEKQPDMNDWFFWESAWRGQFYAVDFALFKAGNKNTAIISDNCGIFYSMRPDLNRVSIVLTRQLDIEEKSDARDASWIKLCSENHKTEGKHRFAFSYYLPETDNTEAAVRDTEHEVKAVHFRLDSVNKFNIVPQGNLPVSASSVSLDGADCVVTANYSKNGDNILRGYESLGKGGKVNVKLNKTPFNIQKTDLAGNVYEEIVPDGNGFSFEITPWEIFTVRYSYEHK